MVVETASPYFNGLGNTIGNARNFDLRQSPSVSKDDKDGDGLADPDGDGVGMGWFPGYVIDVESGKRLNVFLGKTPITTAGISRMILTMESPLAVI